MNRSFTHTLMNEPLEMSKARMLWHSNARRSLGMCALGGSCEGPSAGTPAAHTGRVAGAPGALLQYGPALAAVGTWRMNLYPSFLFFLSDK